MRNNNRRLENLAGAFALAAADQQRAAASGAAGHGAAAPAALTTLLAYPGISIERLRRALGLTHSGGVRLVHRLAGDGLVRRHSAADGRVAALALTPAGRRRARDILRRREQALSDLLAPLEAGDRATLAGLLERVLEPLPSDRDDLERICRLCDYWTCDGSTLACPVGRGARARRDAAPG
jgi:DNA-binding MarR family transcriptional regulator